MQNTSKISTYLGFSVRSGQILYGADTLFATRKHVKLILLCSSLADNAEKKVREYATSRSIPVIKLDSSLEDMIHKKNCKVVGLLNKNLAQAVMDSAKDGLID